jgi:invasion protein IalB
LVQEQIDMNRKHALLAIGGLLLAASSTTGYAATRVQKSFGNWQVNCVEDDKGAKRCDLQFALVNRKAKQVIFSWTIVRGDTKDDKNKVVVRTPTGVLLADGVAISFDGTKPVTVPFKICGPRSCFAEFDFSDEWQKAVGSKPKLTVIYSGAKGEPVKHEVNLEKFAEAYKFLQSQ